MRNAGIWQQYRTWRQVAIVPNDTVMIDCYADTHNAGNAYDRAGVHHRIGTNNATQPDVRIHSNRGRGVNQYDRGPSLA